VEKKKYFKIQPNHAVPTGSAYSADEVKRRRIELETASEIARNVERRRNLVHRARILQNPLIGGSLSREHGHGRLLEGSARTYVEGWDGAEIFPSEASPSPDPRVRAMSRLLSSQASFHTPTRPEEYVHLNRSTVAMGAFEYDSVTHSLFYRTPEIFSYVLFIFMGRGNSYLFCVLFMSRQLLTSNIASNGQTLCEVVERKHDLKEDEPYKPVLLRRSALQLSTNHSPITSITIDPKSRCMLTTWQAPNMGHNVHVVQIIEGEGGDGLFSGADLYVHGM
jgi:hypothetical protein